MAKMTKTQAKRLIKEIENKTKKLFIQGSSASTLVRVTVKDMEAVKKLCDKWTKDINSR